MQPQIRLDDWQKEANDYKGDLLLCTGRRVGKTWILAKKGVDRMAKCPKTQIIMVSLTEDQAKIIMAMALDYTQQKCPKMIGKGKNKPTLRTLTFKNSSKMIVRPVGITGDAVRGFEGGVLIVDEASRMPPMFWIAAKPILLTTGGEIWMGSTPHGKQGYFWEKFDESYNKNKENARFKVIYVSTEEVIEKREICPSWTEEQRKGAFKILEEDKKDMSELEYGQEYLGLFLDDLQQFFPDEMLNKTLVLERPDIKGKNYCYLGVDIARMGGDECAYAILQEKSERMFHQIENITKVKQRTTQTEEDILHLNRQYNPYKIGIDAGSGSLGVGIYDRLLINTETKRKVVPMNNRTISLDRDGKQTQRIFKEDMYHNLKAMMEDGEIQLLRDSKIFLSLKSVQEEINEKTGKTYIKGKYDHIAEALVRAAWLAKKEKIKNFNIYYI